MAFDHVRLLFDRETISNLAGTASFFVWLFAQSPQLYENYKNSSCEGLSFVFLAQWMAGDATNLIGSVLTQQLPFQIAVATYFCCIDVCILIQYYYYWQRDRRLAKAKEKHARQIRHAYRSQTIETARQSGDRPNMSQRGTSVQSTRSAILDSMDPNHTGDDTRRPLSTDRRRTKSGSVITSRNLLRRSTELDSNYRALGEAAKSVAELAAETERRMARREARKKRAWALAMSEGEIAQQRKDQHNNNEEGEEQDEVPDHMFVSITSAQGEEDNQSSDYGFTSTPNIRFGEAGAPKLHSSDIQRGRGMIRTAGVIEAMNAERFAAAEQSPSPFGRRDTSLIMSPVRRKDSSRPSLSRSSTRGNTTPLSARQSGLVLLGVASLFVFGGGIPSHSFPSGTSAMDTISLGNVLSPPSEHTPVEPPSLERMIGRMSAWTCTILYMTSRLPQIWTNMQRKSVQGLSILLFIAAATGNFLYSISVLVNPKAQSPPHSPEEKTAYLMESLPFLLGSGGTLIFDAIIIIQWFSWRGKRPTLHSNEAGGAAFMIPSTGSYHIYANHQHDARSRKSSTRSRWHSLERQPLLQ